MAELKLISPLLSNMEVVECLSVRGAAAVYIVKSTKSGQTYILKHISVPESQKQVDALMFTGAAATTEDAQKYYEQVVSDYQTELTTLEALSASPNLDCFRSYQIAPKEDGVGYDMYLLAEHRKTLVDYLADNAMTKLCAVNLAMDLCSALIDLRNAGLIHRDVKPSNIYLNAQGHFLLGDLGIAKIDDLKYCTMPESMLSSYSAPELFSLLGTIEPTTDIYSVGLILYRIFNGNHAPFEDENTSAKAADRRRVTGEALPVPMYADYEISEIILKACAFKPEDRYQTPQELKDALVEYMKRNQLDDTLIVPPIAGEHEPVDLTQEEEVEPVQFADTEAMPEDFKENFSPDTQMLNDLIDSVHKEALKDPDGYGIAGSLEPDEEDDAPLDDSGSPSKKRRKKSRWLPIALCCLLLIAGIGAAVYFFIKSICEGRELPAYEAASEFTAKIGTQLDKLLPELGGEDGTLKTLEKLQAARNQAQQKLTELLEQMRDSVQNPTLEQAVIDAANQAESKTQQAEAVAKMVDTTARQNKVAISESVSAAVGAAAEKAKEVQTILGAWSDDAGAMEKNAVNTELLQKVRQNPALLEISKHLGRFREIFAQGKRNGYAYGRGETYALELGNDLSRAIGSEFAMLASPQTLPLFVKKYQQRRLKQYRRREPVHKGMGDMICCLDESGSTRGDAAAWGKAVALTLFCPVSIPCRIR